MSQTSVRLLAPMVLLSFGLSLFGAPLAWAANGSVRGQITAEGGPLPVGSTVRATPLTGGDALTTPVGSDGSFLFENVPEGAYQVEVVGPDGAVLSSLKTPVPASDLRLNMRARVRPAVPASTPVAPPAASPAPSPKEPLPAAKSAPAPRQARSSRSSGGGHTDKRKWALIGVIVGGFGAGWAIGNNTNNNNNNASPSQP